jgi:hypothetical protein
MPSAVVKSFAAKAGKSVGKVEKLWDKIKAGCEKKGLKGDRLYKCATGSLRVALHLESLSPMDLSAFVIGHSELFESELEPESVLHHLRRLKVNIKAGCPDKYVVAEHAAALIGAYLTENKERISNFVSGITETISGVGRGLKGGFRLSDDEWRAVLGQVGIALGVRLPKVITEPLSG